MFRKLASHNPDLARLADRGFAVAVDSGYLIVRDIPYLDQQGTECIGAIATKLEFIDLERVKQVDHQIFFAGGVPHEIDGTPVGRLAGGITSVTLGPSSTDVVVQRSFSNKPSATGQYDDFFHKISTYVALISGPAMEKHDSSPYTFREVEPVASDSPFKVQDTLTSRAEITDLTAQLCDEVVVIIGLGGTGSYVLDLLTKTPVKEIRAFDSDEFHVHNAFRSPGRLELNELGQPKADVYRARYDSLRNGLHIEREFIDDSSAERLVGATFAFVCVDKGPSRSAVFDALIAQRIPFIDVGMGLNRHDGRLAGMARLTYYSVEDAERVRTMGLTELTQDPDDLYRTNIQIAELNALNACLAVIEYKKLRGFYVGNAPTIQRLFTVESMKILSLEDSDAT
jgi:hypothetical protein